MKKNQLSVNIGDITELAVDAIVNSANRSLLGGGGVDRAIHRRAGRELLLACMAFDGCPPGESVVTPGFNLPAQWVIHTVGPVWTGGAMNEETILASCYRTALTRAKEKACRTVAFSSISRGIHRFPADLAARIAVETLLTETFEGEVIFCVFTEEDRAAYETLLGRSDRTKSRTTFKDER